MEPGIRRTVAGGILVGMVVGMASVLLTHFVLIIRHGSFFIQEPNTPVLILEVVLLVVCIAFAVGYLATGLLSKPGKRHADTGNTS